ncbi:MAG: helix-turn-helix transcriptional regulator [Pedobacter sp.]|jgi:transcriptional regulator with XRE-family HTH domain|uniref:helix-turn-helix domain-containing protein n=1 Tax=Pedobacter sp. TaxID=1411316 RepID=UPI003390DD5B
MKQEVKEKVRIVVTNIRKVRMYRNYSQHYLAAKLSISQNAYSKIELGVSKLPIERLFKIAVILDVKISSLMSVDCPMEKDVS